MPSPSSPSTPETTLRILITGANTGLGLAICKRMIDEFLHSRPASQTLHLLLTTRSSQKSSQTLSSLRTHIACTASSKSQSHRISLSSYELDLCSLPQVKAAARKICTEHEYLDATICNAGIAGWLGLDWWRAVWDVITEPVQSTTWPRFNIGSLGWVTKRQIEGEREEPRLGQVFCANLFGHWILASLLGELLARGGGAFDGGENTGGRGREGRRSGGRGRLIWTSSINTPATSFSARDLQCLDSREGYDSSKRLTDILALASTQPGADRFVSSFWSSTAGSSSRPEMYVAHPGVVSTEIMPLPYPLLKAKESSFWFARWLGSPWHTITPHKGAVSAVWLALAPQTTLDELEERDGKGKWGSATDFWGEERVRRTEVEGWGFGGKVGAEAKFGRKARRKGTGDLTQKELEEFQDLGVECWRAMEQLRVDWMEKLNGIERE